jgi:hypothetical protein
MKGIKGKTKGWGEIGGETKALSWIIHPPYATNISLYLTLHICFLHILASFLNSQWLSTP